MSGNGGMKKSASEDALNTFIKEDSSLGADGALVFNNVGKWIPHILLPLSFLHVT